MYPPHRIRFAIPFKGARDYVSGSDICSALVKMANANGAIEVVMHKIANHALLASWTDEQEIARLRRSKSLCTLMTYTNPDADPRMIAVVEDMSAPVTESIPFDEGAIAGGATIADGAIRQDKAQSGNIFERIVALNKTLLNETVEVHKWIFCSLTLEAIPPDDCALRLKERDRIGSRLYRSTIEADGAVVGSVTFMRQPS